VPRPSEKRWFSLFLLLMMAFSAVGLTSAAVEHVPAAMSSAGGSQAIAPGSREPVDPILQER
jgi:hypothetical protein